MASIMSAAKQAADEDALLRVMRNDFIRRSMKLDGDFVFEMCRWQWILVYHRCERLLPGRVMDETVSPQHILSMRHSIAYTEEHQVHDKGNTILLTLSWIGLITRWKTVEETWKYKMRCSLCLLYWMSLFGWILKIPSIYILP